LFTNPWWILFTRSSDRLGKGIRTSSRDAILSDEATEETKGAVFGFHRALDTTGAFIGPILALIYLHYYPGEYQRLFILSLIPTFIIILLLWNVKEAKRAGKKESRSIFISSMLYWKEATSEYKKVVSLILVFTLVNSSDMFLLLRVKEITGSDTDVIKFYIYYNIVYAALSYSFGSLSDRLGRFKVYTFGLLLFSATYLLVGLATSSWMLYLAFLLYGGFAASTEGISKAWISSLCKKEDLGVAIGFQNTTQSICAMSASFLAGLIWMQFGSTAVFVMSGSVTLLIVLILIFLHQKRTI
jgi:MFS family permease